MTDRLKGAKIAFLATDMFEQVELTGPWEALTGAGAQLELVSLESGEIQGFNHFDKADLFTVDRTVDELTAWTENVKARRPIEETALSPATTDDPTVSTVTAATASVANTSAAAAHE